MPAAFPEQTSWSLVNFIKFAEGENWDNFSFEGGGLFI